MDPPLSLTGWLRWDVVSRMLESLSDVRTVLEIGAGMGAVGARLAARYDYLGVEPDPTSCRVAQRRVARAGGTVVCGDVASVEPERRFDVVCAFEVLEHVHDEHDVLRSWVERLQPHGTLIVSVPAWQHRWGPSDVRAGHVRRYDRDHLRRGFERVELVDVVVIGYGFPLGFVLQPIWNVLARRNAGGDIRARTASSGRWLQPPDWLAGATLVAAAPFRALQRPFARSDLATGWVAAGRRSR